MKRLWIALAILLAILVGSLANIRYVTRVSNQLVDTLNQAERLAEAGDWHSARTLTCQAQEQWEAHSGILYITLCHATADQVNTGFREVLELIQQEAAEEYSAANGVLIAEVEHLAEVEQLSLANLL